MERVFIAHILSESFIQKYNLSPAACNFSFNLMSGGGFKKTFSILGTYVKGKLNADAYNDKRFELVYCDYLRNKGRLGIMLAVFCEQWFVFKKINKNTSVWFYNVTILNVFLYLLLRLFKRSVKVNVIVLDYTPGINNFGFNHLFLKIINRCSGNIRLADSQLFNNSNYIILPGVVPLTSEKEPLIQYPDTSFLLSGVLFEQISQLTMVLEAFSLLPHCTLHITGKTNDVELINKYVSSNPNIIWHGSVSYSEYIDIMHGCTYVLSTRDPQAPENACNFPSKIIESLLHNRVVISTIAYKQLNGIKILEVSSCLDVFKSQINEISEKSKDYIMEYANQGDLVANMFSTDVWNKAMAKIEEKK